MLHIYITILIFLITVESGKQIYSIYTNLRSVNLS
jgi:hypothetical protein